MARKVLTTLDLNGPLTLTGVAGTSGQVLTSGGTGTTPTWASVASGAMNYAQTLGTKQSAISTAGTTIVSVSITTTGYPVQVTVTGDVENSSAGGWVTLQLYRGATAIGNIIHAEGSAASENSPYALQVVDAPAAGTYTYALKLNSSAGGTFNFGESNGPVITAVELRGVKGDTGASGSSFTGGTLTSNLTLAAGTTSLSPLTFASGTNLTTVTAGANEYDGTVFYQTSNTTPGRALKTQGYYYIHNASYVIDYSGSGAAQSILGGTTTGITLAAGTTYEFELNVAVQQLFGTSNNFTLTHNWQSTTVTGSPVVSYIQVADYGSNTTGFTTAQTNSTVRVTTGGIIVSAAIASGSRYSIYNIKGTIRVTGTGTVKVYPTLAGTAATDNTVTIQSGSRLRLTPIGNGTVTTVGTWA